MHHVQEMLGAGLLLIDFKRKKEALPVMFPQSPRITWENHFLHFASKHSPGSDTSLRKPEAVFTTKR